ncbi:MAG TPA: glycosyl hydrolase family 18 protein [Nocardioidaceae bacterium]|nr:glycosyl hydrolase family 18 protein [Nocardioidaceae bacterium]
MRRALAALAVGGALVAGGSAPSPAAAPSTLRTADPAVRQLPVTGYALGSLPSSVVRRDAHALSTVGVAGVSIRADGAQVRRPNADLTRLLRVAHDSGLSASLLMSNWSERLGRFDTRALGRLLHSRAHRQEVAARLGQIVRRGGWDGVTVDLEALRRSYADDLTAFLAQLRAALPGRASIDIDVSATTRYRSRGYDLRGIARSVDRIALMAYDEHGPSWSDPGPIGSLPWQRRCLKAALRLVPPRQVDLGVAGYGYAWRPGGGGHSVFPRQARQLVADDGAAARWHPRAGEWSAVLSNGTRLWWSDARSWKQRLRLAEHRGLHGLALWRLGSADPLP